MGPLYRFFIRALLTRGRLLAIGALGLVAVGLGLAVGVSDVDDPVPTTFGLISAFGLAGLAPVTALVFASAAFGDLIEDQTMVHLWLRPIPRSRLVLAAVAAVVSIVWPLVVLPIVAATALSGTGGAMVLGAALTSTLAVVVYSCLFCWLGLRMQRALVWGLLYILIWEGAVANVGAGLARFALRLYTRSLLASYTDGEVVVRFGVARTLAVTLPLVVAFIGFGLAVRHLQRADVA